MQKQYEEIRRELDVLNKQRGDDQRRIEKLGQDNAALAEQVKALGANPVTATGEPVPQMPASPPGPEGEPQPGNTPVSFPPQGRTAAFLLFSRRSSSSRAGTDFDSPPAKKRETTLCFVISLLVCGLLFI